MKWLVERLLKVVGLVILMDFPKLFLWFEFLSCFCTQIHLMTVVDIVLSTSSLLFFSVVNKLQEKYSINLMEFFHIPDFGHVGV